MEAILNHLKEWTLLYGPNIIAALAIFIIGRLVARIIPNVIQRVMKKGDADPILISFASSAAYIGTMAFVIIAALSKLGVQTNSFVAVVGAAGLAIAFSLRDSLGNLASGVLMTIFRPFKLGDWVEAGGISGAVEDMGIFATILRTGDNKKVIVPNSKLTSDNITNYSAKPTRRVDLVIGVGYQDDLKQVRKVLEQILSEDDRILPDPAPTIAVLELADSSVNFAVRPWVKTSDYWPVKFDLQETIKIRFDAEGISIPFPQQDVHLFQEAK
jgi:small conductance mechanosensitive channel